MALDADGFPQREHSPYGPAVKSFIQNHVLARIGLHKAEANPHTQYMRSASQSYPGDLNTLVEPGRYSLPYSADLVSAYHAPTPLEGYVEVFRSGSLLWQVYQPVHDVYSGGSWYRKSVNYGATWQDWYKIPSSSEVDTKTYETITAHKAEVDPHPQYLKKGRTYYTGDPNALTQAGAYLVEAHPNAPRPAASAYVNVSRIWGNATQEALLFSGSSEAETWVRQSYTADDPVPVWSQWTRTDGGARDGVTHLVGTGFPEGNAVADIGSTYTDKAATNGAIRWVKASGGRSAWGWQIEHGDTGWRKATEDWFLGGAEVPSLPGYDPDAFLYETRVRRINNTVFLILAVTIPLGWTGGSVFLKPLPGFRPDANYLPSGGYGSTSATITAVLEGFRWYGGPADFARFNWTLSTSEPWPVILPGDPY